MKYKIRKGLESPCVIRGFLSTDYWVFIGACAGLLTLNLLIIRSSFLSGNWGKAGWVLLLSVLLLLFLRIRLKSKTQNRKFKETPIGFTISNYYISRILLKRE